MADHIKIKPVKRRQVFYIPGYDPFPPRRYRELFRSESSKQAAISGYQIAQTASDATDHYGWHVDATIDGAETETDVNVLMWSDLVQRSMSRSIGATYLLMAQTAWQYIGSGALFRLAKMRKGPVIAALYPIVMLTLQLIIALLVGWGAGAAAGEIHPLIGWAVGGGVFVVLLVMFRRIDDRLFAYYLMLDYAYSAQRAGANPPELDVKLAEFRDAVSDALNRNFDEILIVGHSSGAHLAVSLLAQMLRDGHLEKEGPAVSLLTLGHVVPMVSFLPNAGELRRDLRDMSVQDPIFWVDVTAPGDGCSFALCDPVAVSGVATENQKWPLVFSAAFSQSLSPQRWKSLRWRFFRLHFQYLCAFDRPRDYDYFQITAGPMTLAQRYHNRPASKSRIKTPLSGYRSVAS